MADKQIPICPLKSAGSEFDIICSQERCAWYIKPFKMCSVYMLGHKAAMDIQQIQERQEIL
ncbi:hypothetical protein IJ732_04055 [bacterium]|nr:hypothetical protein [bacterium]